ncbi:MAG: hypothetical protein ACRD8W_21925 [Nitrososphaeraceae archaeon]
MTLQDKDSAIPNNMVEFALHMTQECERISKKFYEEADKTPDLEIKIRSSQQGTIYSNLQILFGMIHITMSSINSISDKLGNKEDIDSVRTELMHNIKQYLNPLRKEIDEWKRREEKNLPITSITE